MLFRRSRTKQSFPIKLLNISLFLTLTLFVVLGSLAWNAATRLEGVSVINFDPDSVMSRPHPQSGATHHLPSCMWLRSDTPLSGSYVIAEQHVLVTQV